MRLSIRHKTVYAFEPVSVNGAPVTPLLTDDFGDACGQWHSKGEVDGVEILAEGMVETAETAGVVRNLGRQRSTGVFLRETALTEPDDAICELAAEAAASSGDDGTLAALHALSAAVGGAVEYRPGVTGSDTTAARALALGAGVCQDHAHVFIAAARSLGVPASRATCWPTKTSRAPTSGASCTRPTPGQRPSSRGSAGSASTPPTRSARPSATCAWSAGWIRATPRRCAARSPAMSRRRWRPRCESPPPSRPSSSDARPIRAADRVLKAFGRGRRRPRAPIRARTAPMTPRRRPPNRIDLK